MSLSAALILLCVVSAIIVTAAIYAPHWSRKTALHRDVDPAPPSDQGVESELLRRPLRSRQQV